MRTVEPVPTSVDDLRTRILAATIASVGEFGVGRTTLDEVARRAGCGRATIYRAFPGGKEALVLAAGQRELACFFLALDARLAAAPTLEDALVTALTEASRAIAGHRALQYLLVHEPELVLPVVSFDGLDPLLAWAAEFALGPFGRFVDPATARLLGEWTTRVVLTYSVMPGSPFDLADAGDARRLVRTYLLPGVLDAAASAPGPRVTAAPDGDPVAASPALSAPPSRPPQE